MLCDTEPTILEPILDILCIKFYQKNNFEPLVIYGGLQLRDNLLRYLKADPSSLQALMLIGCGTKDEQTIKSLYELRTNDTVMILSHAGNFNRQVGIDLVLARFGDADATKRMLEMLKYGSTSIFVFYADNIELMDNVTLLEAMLPLLTDKRNARKRFLDKNNTTQRVCDVILEALVRKTGIQLAVIERDVHNRKPPHYTDEELKDGLQKLTAYFEDK